MIAHRPGGTARIRIYPVVPDDAAVSIDYVAVEYAMNREATPLTDEERIETARQLDLRSINLTEVGRIVSRDRNIIVRWKANGWQQPGQATPEREPVDIGDASHGRSGYTKGCRCPACRAGAREYQKARREAKKAARQAVAA